MVIHVMSQSLYVVIGAGKLYRENRKITNLKHSSYLCPISNPKSCREKLLVHILDLRRSEVGQSFSTAKERKNNNHCETTIIRVLRASIGTQK